MNNHHASILAQALDRLRSLTGMSARIAHNPNGSDAKILLELSEKAYEYDIEIKTKIDRFAALNELKARIAARPPTILVSSPLSAELAHRCREQDIQFIDTAGNAYLHNRSGLLIFISGNQGRKSDDIPAKTATINPAALKIIFAALDKPAILNAKYREIAEAAGVSIGAVGSVLDVLKERGFIGTAPSGRRIIISPQSLLSEWAIGYASRLRPKLRSMRFSAPGGKNLDEQWSPGMHVAVWGGEVAAKHLTGHLKPETFTIYMDMDEPHGGLRDLVREFHLRADNAGAIEVIQPFWRLGEFGEFPNAPLHVVYADLISSNNSRNMEVATQIQAQVIEHVRRSGE